MHPLLKTVIKLDYFGEPYDGLEYIERKPDIKKHWEEFIKRFNEQDERTLGQSPKSFLNYHDRKSTEQ